MRISVTDMAALSNEDKSYTKLEKRLRSFEQRLVSVSVRSRDSAFDYLDEGPMCLLTLDADGKPFQVRNSAFII